jgi:threonine dehydrogenase-like Zn-dependent dehydrogenase
MSQSLCYVAAGGSLVFVGLTKEPVTLNDSLLHTREVTIYASRNSRGQFRRIIRMLEESEIKTVP